MAKTNDFLGYFRRKFLDHMLDDLAFWRPSKTLHESDADGGGIPKSPPPPRPPPPNAGEDESRDGVDAATKKIGRHKTKAELDAEARAEALLKKAQSKFYSLE